MNIFVVGAGLGDEAYLTGYAKNIICNAEIVITTKRIYEKMQRLNSNTVLIEISEIVPFILETKYQSICILASGDIGFYSISNTIKDKLSQFNIEFVSGISSLQYLTAKLLIPYDDIKTISVHGREKSVIPYVCYNKKVFVLTGGKYKACDVINELNSCGLGEAMVTVGESLSDENERIITDKAKNLLHYKFDNLSVMLIVNEGFINPHTKIYDDEFIRGKSPMTKEAVRTLSISKLEIKPSDIVYDIGAGTGSVSIEMARCAYEGTVYAIEKEDYALELIEQNKAKFGAYNVSVINAVAPEGISHLPAPNKVFIGGSSGNLREIIDKILNKNKYAKIVVNAITLETLNEALVCFSDKNLATDIMCVNASVSERLGNYNMMKAQNPIYIVSGVYKDENS